MLKTEPLTNISATNQPIIVLTSHSSQFPDSRPGEEKEMQSLAVAETEG